MNGLLCFALPVFAATLYFGWLYWQERQFLGRLRGEGVGAAATIVQREMQTAGRGGMVYFVSYQFDVNGAGTIRQEQVTRKLFNRLDEGERVPIRYLADDPAATARLDGEYQDRSKVTSDGVLCGVCAVLSILFAIALLRT